jgi:hypothetical protein
MELPSVSLYDDTFGDGWKISGDIIYTAGEQNTKLTIHSPESGWKSFYIHNGTNPILPLNVSWAVIKVNYPSTPNGTRFLLSLWNGKEHVAAIHFPSSGSNGWHAYFVRFNSTLVDLIEISFYGHSAPVSFECDLGYLALLK